MIALLIIVTILLLLLLFLLVPIRCAVRFQEEFSLTLSYLFLRKTVLPSAEEATDETKPKDESKPESTLHTALQKIKRILKKKGFWGFLEALYELLVLCLQSGAAIVRKIKLSRFDLYLCVGGADDPAEAAQTYGKLCSGIYPACAELLALTGPPRRKKRKKGVSVDLDYRSAENVVDFSATCSVRPITVLAEAVRLIWKARPTLTDLLRAAKAPTPTVTPSREKGESA